MYLRALPFILSTIFTTLLPAQSFAQEPAATPPGPAPRKASGKILFGGAGPEDKGVWLPVFAIGAHLRPLESIPFKPWAKALYDTRLINQLEPHSRCKASGFVREFQTPYGVEITEIEALEKVYIFDIGGPHTYRTIYMDGRAHPRDLEPSNYGHSIGWWEDDTLVIDTVAYNQDFWLDRRGLPHTEQLHTIEKLTRTNHDTIRYEIGIDDPGAYTAPFDGEFNLRWEDGQELFEYVCQQANYASELMTGTQSTSIERVSHIVP
ncbi:MAG: hypothetical protein V4628_06790 [Pseudomonadota bacterium]